MPISGLGTEGYTGNASNPYGAYPECFNACFDPLCLAENPSDFSSCTPHVEASVTTWLRLGGRRIDNSASYHNQLAVGQAIATSGLPRSQLFITSKVGAYLTMGFNESLAQFASMQATLNTSFVDLLLVHWPSCSTGGGCTTSPASTDPPCIWGETTYNETACRLSVWRAVLQVYAAGGARAVGVSNYNSTHLQEIVDAGLPLPAVNQIPYNLYHSSVQADTVAWCRAHGVLVNGYSPFGVPDRRAYAPPMAPTQLQDPVLQSVAAAHGTSPGNALLAWQWARAAWW